MEVKDEVQRRRESDVTRGVGKEWNQHKYLSSSVFHEVW